MPWSHRVAGAVSIRDAGVPLRALCASACGCCGPPGVLCVGRVFLRCTPCSLVPPSTGYCGATIVGRSGASLCLCVHLCAPMSARMARVCTCVARLGECSRIHVHALVRAQRGVRMHVRMSLSLRMLCLCIRVDIRTSVRVVSTTPQLPRYTHVYIYTTIHR